MDYDIDKFKKMVDNMFKEQEAPKKEPVARKAKLKLPKINLSSEQESFASEKAMQELEEMRLAFIQFRNTVSKLGTFSFMITAFQDFADYANDFEIMIENDIDESKLEKQTMHKYKEIKDRRLQILKTIYDKYSKEHGS